ncbi:uncharacterized protein [Parasteatoda tepidariorum]|uniref:uncharacterized protein isoform X1 n=1 Tax=Parasteatoda tepidariorum TaxID=114398 RepID=UPI001C71EDE5|nr:uncharacterized protein LOC122270129 [Parasteatoda tepidariorum]
MEIGEENGSLFRAVPLRWFAIHSPNADTSISKHNGEKVRDGRNMPNYQPQVDEPASFEGLPPPAYSKGYSVKLELLRLGAKTFVVFAALVGTFVLLSLYINQLNSSSSCLPVLERRSGAEPLVAEPTSNIKLHIGEDIRKVKNKKHLNCLVEREERILNAIPEADAHLEVKGEQTHISCSTNPGKRSRRSPKCECHCAC